MLESESKKVKEMLEKWVPTDPIRTNGEVVNSVATDHLNLIYEIH